MASAGQTDQDEPDCTCTVVAPVRHGCVTKGSHNKYAIYLDFIEDNSVTDPACPYHGDNGTNVMIIYATHNIRPRPTTPRRPTNP